MISLITCSTRKDIPDVLKENIKNSIGVPYELVIIDNSKNEYSIFEAYNLGVEKAKYSILCFIHEDIMFRSSNWGYLLCRAIGTDSSIGVIGAIGSTMVFQNPFGWWDGPAVGHIIDSKKRKHIAANFYPCSDLEPILSDAVTCDGLFLAMPKNIFDKVKFDTKTFTGFHCYDMDTCLQAFTLGYRVVVLENMVIEHFSSGNLNQALVDSYHLLYEKWKNQLPIACNHITQDELLQCNANYLKLLLNNRRWILVRRDVIFSKWHDKLLTILRIVKKIKNSLKQNI